MMALSNTHGWLVLATGNKSEMAVGYATIYGDMVGGFAVLKDVFKTDVFRLARHLNEHHGRELVPVSTIAARFHNALARGTAAVCAERAARLGIETVVLSGGVFQNVLLLERTADRLASQGLRVLLPERLPPNDGGISYGQAVVAIAAAVAARGRS